MPVTFQNLRQFLCRELAPQEGRLAMTWRTAVVCAVVAMIFMVYGIPLAAIACYLVLFVMKPNTTESLLMGTGVIILVGIIIPLLVWLAIISVDNLVVRMLVLSIGSFIFMYLSVASKVGEVGSIVALVIGFIMTLVGIVPFGELLTRGILYAALMAVVPMGVMLILLVVLGPSPAKLAQRHLCRRSQAICAVIRGEKEANHLLPYLREGNADVGKMLLFSTLFFQQPKLHLVQLTKLMQSSYQLIAVLMTLPADREIPTVLRERWIARCEMVEDALKAGVLIEQSPDISDLGGSIPMWLEDIELRMRSLPMLPEGAVTVSSLPKSTFFNGDIATNHSYVEFGLKVTFSALICYLIYTALEWQDIHTAMITCYVAALGTVGETTHKMILRISGCLVGAALGCMSILFLMPHMTNIGQLMALVFSGCMVAAWVAQGSPRISYAGVQIGLAFLLTVLQGFGPEVNISIAIDRVYGILLGNFVLFVVFTQVWPTSTSSHIKQALIKYISGLVILLKKPQANFKMQAALPELIPQLQGLREQAALIQFESAILQVPVGESEHIQRKIDELEALYLNAAFNESSLKMSQVQEQVHYLQRKVITGGIV